MGAGGQVEIRISHRLPRHSRIARKLALPVGVALALALVITPVGAATTPLACGSSFDPYAYTRAAVSACGYKTFPLAAVKALPGGGSSYDYRVNGAMVRFYVPPKGFDPSTATAAKLNEYGFPPRPKVAAALSRWHAQMRAWKGSARPAPFLAETHMSPDTTYSENWSGYSVTGSAGTYTHAEAWYLEPTYYSSRCSTNAEVTWAGLGGNSSGDPLGQDGTGYGVPGLGAHQAWWYILPGYSGAVPVPGLYGHSGIVFDASVRWLGDAYRFYMEDYYSDTTMAFDVSTSSYSGDSAEAIAERPRINSKFSNLSNFGTLSFEQTEANGVYFNNYSPDGLRHGIHMYNPSTGDDLADPNTISTDGYFTDTQKNCN
jgi:Peptidase A4 family